jgi:hypothetical protein
VAQSSRHIFVGIWTGTTQLKRIWTGTKKKAALWLFIQLARQEYWA